jgi:hypothetical protein
MSGRRWWTAVSAVLVIGAGVAVPVGLAAPAGAAPAAFTETCAGVYGQHPVGDLEKTTDPAAGSAVLPGQTVQVTLHWPTFAVAGQRAHRLLECLSVDGGPAQTWVDRQFSTAEGTFAFSETVPAGLAPRTTVCGQSFLETQGSFGPVTRWSDKTCYPVGSESAIHALSRSPSPPSGSSPQNRSTPTTRSSYSSPPASPPSGSGAWKAPWPPWEKSPKVSAATPPVLTTPTTAATTTTTAPKTRKAAGSQAAAPVIRKSPGAPAGTTLPRTGAGVLVLLAIAAVALFSGRTLRKASDHIAENLPVPAVPIDDDDEPTLVLGRRW